MVELAGIFAAGMLQQISTFNILLLGSHQNFSLFSCSGIGWIFQRLRVNPSTMFIAAPNRNFILLARGNFLALLKKDPKLSMTTAISFSEEESSIDKSVNCACFAFQKKRNDHNKGIHSNGLKSIQHLLDCFCLFLLKGQLKALSGNLAGGQKFCLALVDLSKQRLWGFEWSHRCGLG